jgi:hypothetical protein
MVSMHIKISDTWSPLVDYRSKVCKAIPLIECKGSYLRISVRYMVKIYLHS